MADMVAGAAYADLIKEQLTQERARKASIEARGVGIITTSGGLVTILFAISALATKSAQTYTLPDPAKPWLVGALILFVVAALLGLAANLPLPYDEVIAEGLDAMVSADWWTDPDKIEADRAAAAARVTSIKSGRRSSSLKAFFLILGVVAEILAVIALAFAANTILAG